MQPNTAVWGDVGFKNGAEIKVWSSAVVHVILWGVKDGGCWVALWDAEVKMSENISNAELFVKSDEILTVGCRGNCWSDDDAWWFWSVFSDGGEVDCFVCWDATDCIDDIEFFEITGKNSTGLNICCKSVAKNANANVDANANATNEIFRYVAVKEIGRNDDLNKDVDDVVLIVSTFSIFSRRSLAKKFLIFDDVNFFFHAIFHLLFKSRWSSFFIDYI